MEQASMSNKRFFAVFSAAILVIPAASLIWSGKVKSYSVGDGLKAEYYANINLSSAPALSKVEPTVNFNWGSGSPDWKIPSNNFSARWSGQARPRFSEAYTFSVVSDDGVRLWVDNKLLIDNWSDHAPTENKSPKISLVADQLYNIKLEYFEHWGGSMVQLFWSSSSQSNEIIPSDHLYSTSSTIQTGSGDGLSGAYYNDLNFSILAERRKDPKVDFDWGYNQAVSSVNPDNFSVRWTGFIQPLYSEIYTFYTFSDDGVRLWVNDRLIIDNWTDHATAENAGGLSLVAGQKYPIKMEFYERGGQAVAKLFWASPNQAKQLIPSSQFYSDPQVSSPVTTISPAPVPAAFSAPQPAISSSNPFAGAKFYVDPASQAASWANANRASDPYNASLMDKVASNPAAIWLGNWNADLYSDVNNAVAKITSAGALPVFVAYNIPQRDCGGYSAGGLGSPEGYRAWIKTLAEALGNRKAVVFLEPDSLSLMDCLSGADQSLRMQLLSEAVATLKANANTAVYLDAGHSGWIPTQTMAERLNKAGVAYANGFVLNISNFITTADNLAYGKQISGLAGNKQFVIDTSRNGQGPTPDYQWCNPSGRGLGNKPTTATGDALVDAYYWIKTPGESDGNCNGGPSAGVFWPSYALGLAQRASF